MTKFLIFKAGTTHHQIKLEAGDTHQWIIEAINRPHFVFDTLSLAEMPQMPDFSQYKGLFITGSHSNVTEQLPWMQYAHQLLKHAMHQAVPILGICFGHQLLADALGGIVDYHPKGPENGVIDVGRKPIPDELTQNLPGQFKAFAAHEQTVKTLPVGAVCLGGNLHEPHHIVKFAPHSWGVQYHPEFTPVISNHYFDMENIPGNRGTQADYDEALATGNILLTSFITYCLAKQ